MAQSTHYPDVNCASRPLVTVVTATFNALEGLKETVRNVSEQTFESFEHVIVDGGSTDGTLEFLESLGDSVRWLSEPDNGIADAMNKGVAMARGEWILILHAEDVLYDRYSLASAASQFMEHWDIVAFEVLFTQADGSSRVRKSRPFSIRTHLRPTSPHQGMFCRRSLFHRIGGFRSEFRIGMDYDFLLRAKGACAKLKPVNQVLSKMPATGVSSKIDWPSVSKRYREDRRLQWANARGFLDKVAFVLYWALYLPLSFVLCRFGVKPP